MPGSLRNKIQQETLTGGSGGWLPFSGWERKEALEVLRPVVVFQPSRVYLEAMF